MQKINMALNAVLTKNLWKEIHHLARNSITKLASKANLLYFFKWMSEQYIRLEKESLTYPFKLSFSKKSRFYFLKKESIFLRVELSGRKDILDIELAQIIQQNLFEFFSPEDKKNIFSVYHNKERLKLTESYYCTENQTEMVVITEILTGKNITKPVYLVSENYELINQLSCHDIKKLSFLSASDHFKKLFKRNRQ